MNETLDIITRERALIFRLTHRSNVPWILRHGVHSRNSDVLDPSFVAIGLADLIDRRATSRVGRPGQGVLSDYIPFYFTPRSPMAYRIRTGRGVPLRPNAELVFIVSSVPRLLERGIEFLFTDRHASMATARWSNELDDLDWIDWPLLRSIDFRRDDADLGKLDRYQAEVLVRPHLPVSAIIGLACPDSAMCASLDGLLKQEGVMVPVAARPQFFFP